MNSLDIEKINSQFPLTDENLAFFDEYFKPLEELVELRPANPKITLRIAQDNQSEEYWSEQKALMIRTMEESKRHSGRF